MIVKLVLALLEFAVALAENISQRRLMKAGENVAIVKAMEAANARITKALAARRAIIDGVPATNDPYIRD